MAGLGVYFIVAWVIIFISSIILACLHLYYSGIKPSSLWQALMSFTAGLMFYAFVSAYIGYYELVNYTHTKEFWLSIAIGLAAVWMFCQSIRSFHKCMIRSVRKNRTIHRNIK